jgi:hypothetical protein
MSVLRNGTLSTTTLFMWQHPRRPSIPANRSNPDSLTPGCGKENGKRFARVVCQE